MPNIQDFGKYLELKALDNAQSLQAYLEVRDIEDTQLTANEYYALIHLLAEFHDRTVYHHE